MEKCLLACNRYCVFGRRFVWVTSRRRTRL